MACDGYRLKPEALAVKIDGKHIGEISRAFGQASAGDWFSDLPAQAQRQSRTRSPRASSRKSATG
jgi:excinuclease ABC subunit A